jgi:hypothetical protein
MQNPNVLRSRHSLSRGTRAKSFIISLEDVAAN